MIGSKDNLISREDLKQHTDLMLSLEQVVKELKQETHDKKLMEQNSCSILKSVQECLSSIKLQIERLKTEQNGFIEARRDRSLNCDRIHDDHEQRLRDMPNGFRCKQNEKKVFNIEKKVDLLAPLNRVETIEKKLDNFVKSLYKVIGGAVVIAILIPPVVTPLFNWVFKLIVN